MRQVQAAGMITTDGCLGVTLTGMLNSDGFRNILKAIPEGTWEFVCHPGYSDEELSRIRTRLRGSRAVELAMLTDSDVRSLLEENRIELICYRDLV